MCQYFPGVHIRKEYFYSRKRVLVGKQLNTKNGEKRFIRLSCSDNHICNTLFLSHPFSYLKFRIVVDNMPHKQEDVLCRYGFLYLARYKIGNEERTAYINHSIKGDLNNE